MAGWVDYSSSSGAAAGAGSGSTFDTSGFTVNIGSGSAASVKGGLGAVPQWVYIAAAVVAVLWLKQRA